MRSSKLIPSRVPPIDFIPSAAKVKERKKPLIRRDETSTPKNVSSLNEKTDSDSALMKKELNRDCQLSDYHPDTESGESRLSDTTEYFRFFKFN